jgi:DNA modification methylase
MKDRFFSFLSFLFLDVYTTFIRKTRKRKKALGNTPASVHHADSRHILTVLEPNSIDAVITSPLYLNEKDYTRITRLESVLLGFIQSKAELRSLKEGLIRSNTRNVLKADTIDNRCLATCTLSLENYINKKC